MYYVSLLATYIALNNFVWVKTGPCLSPMQNESKQGAEEHSSFLYLDFYACRKMVSNGILRIENSYSVVQSIRKTFWQGAGELYRRKLLVGFQTYSWGPYWSNKTTSLCNGKF